MFEMLTGRQRARGLVLTGLERDCACRARTNHRPDARGQRRAPARRAPRRSPPSSEASRPFSIPARKRRKPLRRPSLLAAAARSGAAASPRSSSCCWCWRARSRRGGCAGNDHRDAGGPAVPEERLRRRLRDDARGGRHRSGRRSRHAARHRQRSVAERAKHSADACARRSRDGSEAREAGAAGSRLPASATISSSTTRRLSRRRSSGCTAMRCRRSIATTISPRRWRSANTRSRSITRPVIVPAVCVWRLAGRHRRRRISSSAIRCSPARSAGPICLAAITRR